MKAEEDGERRGDRRHNAPEDDVVVVELRAIHVVLLDAERLREPEAHVDEYEESDERAAGLDLLDALVARVHLEALDDEYALEGALEYGDDLNGERERLDVRVDALVDERYDAVEAEQVDAGEADDEQDVVVVELEVLLVLELVELELDDDAERDEYGGEYEYELGDLADLDGHRDLVVLVDEVADERYDGEQEHEYADEEARRRLGTVDGELMHVAPLRVIVVVVMVMLLLLLLMMMRVRVRVPHDRRAVTGQARYDHIAVHGEDAAAATAVAVRLVGVGVAVALTRTRLLRLLLLLLLLLRMVLRRMMMMIIVLLVVHVMVVMHVAVEEGRLRVRLLDARPQHVEDGETHEAVLDDARIEIGRQLVLRLLDADRERARERDGVDAAELLHAEEWRLGRRRDRVHPSRTIRQQKRVVESRHDRFGHLFGKGADHAVDVSAGVIAMQTSDRVRHGGRERRAVRRVMLVAYLGDRLVHDGAHEHAEVGAYDVHEADDGEVAAVVDDDVGVLEDEERLHEYEGDAERLGDDGHDEGDVAVEDHRVVVEVRLEHLYEAEAAVDHGAYAEDGRADAHVELAGAVLVVVDEVELGQVGRGHVHRHVRLGLDRAHVVA